MRVSGDSDSLAQAAMFAARHAARGSTPIPVLSGLRLTASEEAVRLAGYDYEAATTVTVPLTVHEPGDVLLPGRVFAEVLRSLPSGTVEVATTGSTVRIAAGDIDFGLPTLPLDDYPRLPAMPPVLGTVPGGALAATAQRMARVALREDVLPILSGTLVEFAQDRLRLSASDRFRIAIAELPWHPAGDASVDAVVVPARLLAETTKGLSATAEVGLGVGDDAEAVLGLAAEGIRATMRLVDGTFPSLASKVPSTFIGSLTVAVEALRAALRRVCIVADRHAAVVLTVERDALIVGAAGDGETRGRERLPCVCQGEPTTTAFNAGYLLDGLDALETPWARLDYNEGVRAALLTGTEDESGRDSTPPTAAPFRYVVMPRRLST